MTTLILCGYTESETAQFLDAEKALLDELIATKGLGNGNEIHTLRLKGQIPAPDAEESLSRDLVHAFGLEQHQFQTERFCQGDIPFLAIYVAGERAPQAAIAVPAPKVKRSLPRIRWKIPALVLGGLLLLSGIYYGVGFLLVRQINERFASGNCESLMPVAETVKSIYPTRIVPFAAPALDQMEECGFYLAAAQDQEAGAWEKALKSYEGYLTKYPSGVKAVEAKNGAADTLLSWAEEQYGDKEYEGALDHLFLLLSKYKGTTSAATAKSLVPKYYLTWGTELREGSSYLAAEGVLWDFQEWADKNGAEEDKKNANRELAWLYYYWAGDLADGKEYENAVSTYERVSDLEPTPKAADGPSALTNQELPAVRVLWADELVLKKQFDDAIEQYELAVAATKGSEARADLLEKVARTYIKWADSRVDLGDFWGAFERIDTAKRKSTRATVQEAAEAARTQTLHDFSISQTLQARMYMEEVAAALIEEQKIPELPVFGINTESVRIYPYFASTVNLTGDFGGLDPDILPQTPGQMHYVAYVTQMETVVQTCTYYYVSSGAYAGDIQRHRYSWRVNLVDVKTGKIVQNKELTGPSPDGCPYSTYGTNDIWGQPPDRADLEKWLRKFVK